MTKWPGRFPPSLLPIIPSTRQRRAGGAGQGRILLFPPALIMEILLIYSAATLNWAFVRGLFSGAHRRGCPTAQRWGWGTLPPATVPPPPPLSREKLSPGDFRRSHEAAGTQGCPGQQPGAGRLCWSTNISSTALIRRACHVCMHAHTCIFICSCPSHVYMHPSLMLLHKNSRQNLRRRIQR